MTGPVRDLPDLPDVPDVSDAPDVADVLVRIVERRREVVGAKPPGATGGTGDRLAEDSPGAEFLGALRERSGNAILAEVKMGSPKLGDLRDRVDPEAQARIYRAGGAAALSVVVEPDHFHGGYDLLERCRRASGLPAIAKDFVVSPRQLHWARDAGAGAVLLIAALYEADDLADWMAAALDLGLVPLIETHTVGDVAKLAATGGSPAELVGVNNRDLRTFEVDLQNSMDLLPRLPAGAVKVAESGIAGRGDIETLASAGFDAFLIGESLLLADDPAAKLSRLLGEA